MLWNRDKLFCEINPACYAISLYKEIVKRHIKNMLSKRERKTAECCFRVSVQDD